jgi:hypothetical protein
MDGF